MFTKKKTIPKPIDFIHIDEVKFWQKMNKIIPIFALACTLFMVTFGAIGGSYMSHADNARAGMTNNDKYTTNTGDKRVDAANAAKTAENIAANTPTPDVPTYPYDHRNFLDEWEYEILCGQIDTVRSILMPKINPDYVASSGGYTFKLQDGTSCTKEAYDKEFSWYTKISEMNFTESLIQAMKVFGIGLVMFILAQRFIEAAHAGKNVPDALVKIGIQFFITLLIIISADKLIDVMSQWATLMSSQLTSIALNQDGGANGMSLLKDSSGNYTHPLLGDIKVTKLTGQIHGVFVLVIPYILTFLVNMATYVLCFSVLIELMVRKIFVPFALGNCMMDGVNSKGVQYLKKYFACALRSGVMVMICLITSYLMSIAYKNHIDHLTVVIIALKFTSVGLMLKAGEWCNELV